MKHLLTTTSIFAAFMLSACADAPSSSAVPAQPFLSSDMPVTISEYMRDGAILNFSETREWRHEEGIAGVAKALVELENQSGGLDVFSTEDSRVFTDENLKRFSIIVFNNMTGDSLTPAQEQVVKTWTEAGGGIIAIHGSGDSSHSDWPWYAQKVIGPTFISHPMDPQFQEAAVTTLAPDHPVMHGVPENWTHSEEWYTFDSAAQDHGMTVLAGIDEASYSPVNKVYGVEDLRMDKDGIGPMAHPVIWSSCIGDGRVVFSALGHLDSVYAGGHPRTILENAIKWVSNQTDTEGAGCKA